MPRTVPASLGNNNVVRRSLVPFSTRPMSPPSPLLPGCLLPLGVAPGNNKMEITTVYDSMTSDPVEKVPLLLREIGKQRGASGYQHVGFFTGLSLQVERKKRRLTCTKQEVTCG